MSNHPNNKEVSHITRRKALQIALVTSGGLVAGNLLAACGGEPTQQTQTPPSAPSLTPTPRNQTLLIDQVEFNVFDSFNAYIPNGQQYNAGLYQACQEFLFYLNMATGEIKPWLAQKWEYNEGNTQLTLTLNPKAHWNDGTAFTSKDIEFTLKMLLGNNALLGATKYIQFVKDVKSPDAQTVVIDLKVANPRFHYNLICGIVSALTVVPAHIWEGQDPMSFKDNPPVRTGPYKFDRAIEAQKMFIWKKDPNYWNKAEFDPKPEYVVYRTMMTADSEVEEFKRGQVDVPSQVDYTHATAIQNSGYKNMIMTQKFRDPCPRAFVINSDPSKGLLSDPKMHWAISYLVDRKTLAETVWTPPTVPAQYPWADYPGNDKWSNQEIAGKYQLTYDPQKAATLLDELGAKAGSDGKRTYQGKPLQYEIATYEQVGKPEYINAQKLADEMNKIGIEATVRYYAGAVHETKMEKGEFDISTYYICGSIFDPGQLYTKFEIVKTRPIGENVTTGDNFMRANYKDLDAVALQLDSVNPDDPNAKALYDQGLEAYYKSLPFVPVYQTTYPSVFNTTYWKGWPTDDNLYNVPSNWWGQFLFVIGSVEPTGQA